MQRWLAALAAPLLAAAAWAADAPRQPDGLLAVPPLARVTDLAGALAPADRSALEAKLAAFEREHGSQIAVLVVPSTAPEPIADFTNRVGAEWKIGRRGVGDGALVVVAVADRKAWISVARALEGAVPDAAAGRIVRDTMGPRFAKGDYSGGLTVGVDALVARITGEGLPAPVRAAKDKADAGEDAFALLIPFVVIGVVVGAILRRVLGVPGALLAGGGAGTIAAWLLSSLLLGGLAGIAVFFLSLGGGARAGRSIGRRRGGFDPRGSWGGGGWSGGGGFSGGGGHSGGGGFSSGGGGDFSGGGGGGSW
ncbi:MAG: TPM domain-containing protein [Betaproteobacteria bacterium]